MTHANQASEETTRVVRGVIKQFAENGRYYFKIGRVARLAGKSKWEVACALLLLEEEGVLGRWNPGTSGATVWTVEDNTAGIEETTDD